MSARLQTGKVNSCPTAIQICDATTGHTVTSVAFCDTVERAASIVRAVNSHDDLLAALQGMVSVEDAVTNLQAKERLAEWLPKARAAIEKATQL